MSRVALTLLLWAGFWGFALALWRRGFEARVRPGAYLSLRRGDFSAEPAGMVEGLVSGAISADDWARFCEEHCSERASSPARAG